MFYKRSFKKFLFVKMWLLRVHDTVPLNVYRYSLITLNWLAWLLTYKNDQNRANTQMSFLWESKVWKDPSGNKYVPWSINSVMRPTPASPFLLGSICSPDPRSSQPQTSSETGRLQPLRELVRTSATLWSMHIPQLSPMGLWQAPPWHCHLVSKEL